MQGISIACDCFYEQVNIQLLWKEANFGSRPCSPMPPSNSTQHGEMAKALTLYVVGFTSVLMVYSIYTHIKTLQTTVPERGRRRRDKWDSNKKRRLEDGMCHYL